MSVVHICRPGGAWALNRFHCPWCDEERDSIVRLVFLGYEADDRVCEWCGTWFSGGYQPRMPERERNENRELFAQAKADPMTRRVESSTELMDWDALIGPDEDTSDDGQKLGGSRGSE